MKKALKSHILHIGCGNEKVFGSVGVDLNPESQADVIHDLNKFPYPFAANSFDRIIAINIIEHLDNVIHVMDEIYRIAKNGAKVSITSSHFSSVDSFTDPTHKHFITSNSFDYFIPGTSLYNYGYSKSYFLKSHLWVGPQKNLNPLLKLLLKFINKNLVFYEKRFAFIFPVGCISFELEVRKSS